jgi:hypothetical protein
MACTDPAHCSCPDCRSHAHPRIVRTPGGKLRVVAGKKPERMQYGQGQGGAANPWAVCHASASPKKTAKFERCVMDVKEKQGIKKG